MYVSKAYVLGGLFMRFECARVSTTKQNLNLQYFIPLEMAFVREIFS